MLEGYIGFQLGVVFTVLFEGGESVTFIDVLLVFFCLPGILLFNLIDNFSGYVVKVKEWSFRRRLGVKSDIDLWTKVSEIVRTKVGDKCIMRVRDAYVTVGDDGEVKLKVIVIWNTVKCSEKDLDVLEGKIKEVLGKEFGISEANIEVEPWEDWYDDDD